MNAFSHTKLAGVLLPILLLAAGWAAPPAAEAGRVIFELTD